MTRIAIIFSLLFAIPVLGSEISTGIYCHDDKYPQGYFFEEGTVYLYDDLNIGTWTQRLPYSTTHDKILFRHERSEWGFSLDRKSLELTFGHLENRIQVQCEIASLTDIKAKLSASASRKQAGNKL